VELLAELSGGGPVLEFGIGTGRLALPLAARGIAVSGIDGSPEMVEELRTKPGGADLPVVVGNFAETRVEGEFALVVLAYNTVFALPDQRAQVDVFRNAATHLAPGGRFVVEAWVPDPGAFRGGRAVRIVAIGEHEVQLEAAEVFPADQTMRTAKIRLADGGVRLLPAVHRYAWPAELDLMAELAGLAREHRWSDWSRAPFTDSSTTHLSVYRRPA
jgi:SAM-dependent methyltransferase